MEDYMKRKEKEIEEWNEKIGERDKKKVKKRSVKNIGKLREYVEKYMRNNKGIKKRMKMIVRKMDKKKEGMKIEIYCFKNKKNWEELEKIK